MGSLLNFSLVALAMLAFAGNSLLCRVALKGGAIDAASFTSVRLLSGAITLGALLCGGCSTSKKTHNPKGR